MFYKITSLFQAFCIGMAAALEQEYKQEIAIANALGGLELYFWMWIISIISSAPVFEKHIKHRYIK